MDSYEGPATIRVKGVELPVQCSWRKTVDPRTQLAEWQGSFTAEGVLGLQPGAGELVIPVPEATGTIIVNGIHTTPAGIDGTFVGSGPAPQVDLPE
jgi:hypothetical protein